MREYNANIVLFACNFAHKKPAMVAKIPFDNGKFTVIMDVSTAKEISRLRKFGKNWSATLHISTGFSGHVYIKSVRGKSYRLLSVVADVCRIRAWKHNVAMPINGDKFDMRSVNLSIEPPGTLTRMQSVSIEPGIKRVPGKRKFVVEVYHFGDLISFNSDSIEEARAALRQITSDLSCAV